MEFTEATTQAELSLSALEGLNLTGQRVKLSIKANAPEKTLNSSFKSSNHRIYFFFQVKKINTQSPLSGEGHASPQLINPSTSLHTAEQAASWHCYLSFPLRSSESCQPLLSRNSDFATTL